MQNSWQEASIYKIIEEALVPYEGLRDQIDIQGPDLRVPARRVIGLALALHELITNAVKYGALSVPEGRVAMSWTSDQNGAFCFKWAEANGPVVTSPQRQGFGSAILSSITGSYFSGKADMVFNESGFVYELNGSLSE